MFHQMEGLIVDTNISFTNLKGTLHDFLRNFFEEDLQIASVLPTSRLPNLLQKWTSWVKRKMAGSTGLRDGASERAA